MKLLIIKTSQPEAAVFAVDSGQVKASRHWQSTPLLGQQLLGAIDEVLQECGWQLSDLARVAVHHGPGATSALRQGVITAAMLAQTHGLELVGISGNTDEQLIAAAHRGQPQETIQPDYRRSTR